MFVGPSREPLWPAGVVGSITHSGGYCGAAVARAAVVGALGIDAEWVVTLDDDVVETISTPRERAQIAGLADVAPWPLLVFSSKESVFKALFPATRRWLDFADIEIELSPAEGTFAAQVTGVRSTVAGRFAIGFGYVFTAVVAPPGVLEALAPA